MVHIPPRILWPGLCIGLLVLSLTMNFAGLYFARSDGGAEVVPEHYEKSVDYEETYRARQRFAEMGWEVDVDLEGAHGELTVVDADGEPISDLEGTVTLFRPEKAGPVATVSLAGAPDEPGVYWFDDATTRPGIWDLDVELKRGDEVFVDSIRTRTD